jgi:hypothetical protein
MANAHEGSGGGAMSVLVWAIVSVVLMGWVTVTLHKGRPHVDSSTTQSSAPAAPDSKNP